MHKGNSDALRDLSQAIEDMENAQGQNNPHRRATAMDAAYQAAAAAFAAIFGDAALERAAAAFVSNHPTQPEGVGPEVLLAVEQGIVVRSGYDCFGPTAEGSYSIGTASFRSKSDLQPTPHEV